jgi:signal peptidase I
MSELATPVYQTDNIPDDITFNDLPDKVAGADAGTDPLDHASKPANKIFELLKIALAAIIIAYLIKTFIIQPFKIPTGSMEDTLIIGDFIIANKLIYGAQSPSTVPLTDIPIPQFRLPSLRDPKPGDVIIFKFPHDPNVDYVKRCIATGNQTVEIRNKKIFIDGESFYPDEINPNIKHEDPDIIAYDKGYENVYPIGAGSRDNYGPVTVPEGHIFVMGDNRDRSYDSRKWGFVPIDHIVGKAIIIYWSSSPEDDFNIRWSRIGKTLE